MKLSKKINKCKVCKEEILIEHFDIMEGFEEISPVTFRKAKFHYYCFLLEVEEAEQTESGFPHLHYNRFDEYIDRELSLYC
jgi:hypothetical protein